VAKTEVSRAETTPAGDKAQAPRFDPAARFTDAAGAVYQPAPPPEVPRFPGEPAATQG
jgi:hypothetical protein